MKVYNNLDETKIKNKYISHCKNCEEDFIDTQPPSRAHKFCSKSCELVYSRENYGKGKCAHCGKDFYFDTYVRSNGSIDYKRTKYCSIECLNANQKKNTRKTCKCKNCGKQIDRKLSKSGYYYDIAYCSKKCEIEYQNKNRTYIISSIDRKIDDLDNKLKYCNTCKQWKTESDFNKDITTADGLSTTCKHCLSIKRKENYDSAKNKQRYLSNIEYYTEYYQQNKEKKKAYQKEYNQRNKEHKNKVNNEYYQQNKEEINKQRRKEYKNNPELKLNTRMSNFIYQALKSKKASKHWEEFLNYSLADLKQHLESQFTPEMNWDNIGSYWEIDHIIPKNLFSYSSSDDLEFKICWSLLNLRPLSWIENRRRPKDGSDVPENIKQQILNQTLN